MAILGCLAALGVAVFAVWASPAVAQPYPAKPIRIICAFPVGGIADNRAGAGGTIAAPEIVRRWNGEIMRIMQSPDIQARLPNEARNSCRTRPTSSRRS
jgi:tripartite-type tricarboxylate transporter receptor subunit TctC